MPQKTVGEIAEIINGELVGNGAIVITGVGGIKEAQKGDITFLANPKYMPLMSQTKASAIITSFEIDSADKPIIRTENPSIAFTETIALFAPHQIKHPQGIHPTAVVSQAAVISENVAIGAYAIIEDGAEIQENSIIYGGCFVGSQTQVGADCILYPNVTIRERITIGNRVVIQSGAVIGADGFGYVCVNGEHKKIPQIGTVIIEDDCEIGANVTIDRARFEKTVIGKGTKIDNLVQIAHNVITGKNCIIVAQAGISGSTTLGESVTLAGQAGLVGHITIGDNAIVAAQGGVIKSVPANTMVSGYPAKPHETAKKVNACVQRLPQLYKTIDELKKRIEELERKL
ncbi:UDP-3-O-(3-hydroxymyristoyl)glucosamine N-acyltransferase [Candidatus Omnitrophota bacterium]